MRTIVPNDQRLNKFECFRQRIQPIKRNLEIREKAIEKQKIKRQDWHKSIFPEEYVSKD